MTDKLPPELDLHTVVRKVNASDGVGLHNAYVRAGMLAYAKSIVERATQNGPRKRITLDLQDEIERDIAALEASREL